MNEKIIERKLVEAIRDLGGVALKLLSSLFSGLPDRLVLMPGGRLWFVEVKTTGKKVSIIQANRHRMLRRLGFSVYVIDCMEDLNEFLIAVRG